MFTVETSCPFRLPENVQCDLMLIKGLWFVLTSASVLSLCREDQVNFRGFMRTLAHFRPVEDNEKNKDLNIEPLNSRNNKLLCESAVSTMIITNLCITCSHCVLLNSLIKQSCAYLRRVHTRSQNLNFNVFFPLRH